MRTILNIAVAIAFSALLCSIALAQAPTTRSVVSQESIVKSVEDRLPKEIEVDLTAKSKEQVSTQTCEKTLSGLGVKQAAKCCEKKGCPERHLKKAADKAAYEKGKEESNRRWCKKYGGDDATCDSSAASVRQFVLAEREKVRLKCLNLGGEAECDQPTSALAFIEQHATSSAADLHKPMNKPVVPTTTSIEESMDKLYADCLAVGGDKLRCSYREEAKKIIAAGKVTVKEDSKVAADNAVKYGDRPSSYATRSHFLELGFGLGWLSAGAALGDIQLNYSPPILGDRLLIGVAGGGAVVYKDRLKLTNFNPLFRAEAKGKILFNFVNSLDREFQVGIGPSFTRIGRWSMDKLTASMPGATLRLKFGAFVAEGEWVYNLGPKDGYVNPGSSFIIRAGFNAADLALSR